MFDIRESDSKAYGAVCSLEMMILSEPCVLKRTRTSVKVAKQMCKLKTIWIY